MGRICNEKICEHNFNVIDCKCEWLRTSEVKGRYKSTGQLIAYYQVRITIKIVAHLKRKKKIF